MAAVALKLTSIAPAGADDSDRTRLLKALRNGTF